MNIMKYSRAISSVNVESKINISETSCDDGDRASLWNVGFWLNNDVADCPRRFYKITVLLGLKYQLKYLK
jgi:hypothetical protein